MNLVVRGGRFCDWPQGFTGLVMLCPPDRVIVHGFDIEEGWSVLAGAPPRRGSCGAGVGQGAATAPRYLPSRAEAVGEVADGEGVAGVGPVGEGAGGVGTAHPTHHVCVLAYRDRGWSVGWGGGLVPLHSLATTVLLFYY